MGKCIIHPVRGTSQQCLKQCPVDKQFKKSEIPGEYHVEVTDPYK
jgi:hypothetical protein